jgi:hypothetical protein
VDNQLYSGGKSAPLRRSVHLTDSWTLNNTAYFGRLRFNWCRLYRAGRLRRRSEAKLLPVRVTGESCTPPASWTEPGGLLASSAGTIHIQLQHAQVRVESDANPVLLRVLLECLQR